MHVARKVRRAFAALSCLGLLLGVSAAWAQATDPDLNNDGIVNILDISLVGSCFGADLSTNPDCKLADTDGDGDVDMDDLMFVVASFGQSFPVSPFPVLAITDPANLSLSAANTVGVSGTVDREVASVEVNGVSATVSGQNWSTVVPLNEGNNTLTAVAVDAAGNIGTASIQVTRDTTAPQVTIDSPGDGFNSNSALITVAGMINDIVVGTVNGDQAQVTVNGIPAQVANRSFLVADVPLSPGPNAIVAIGTDRAGNTTSTSITVTFVEIVGEPQINLVSGNNQIGPIGAPLPLPLSVELLDAAGNPAAGATVIFKVTENNGTLSNSPGDVRALAVQTGADGRAQVNWTLGTRSGAGNNMVEAIAVGFSSMSIFTATALPSTADKINVDAGNNQTGVGGESLPRPIVAVVTDAGHNRLANVPVTFTVIQGGGEIGGQPTATVNTDSDGRALAVLTLGLQSGIDNNVVEVDFPGNPGFPTTFFASGKAAGDAADTRISGVVLDNTNTPIPGVTMSIEGTALATQTDAEGQFVLEPAPVGHVKLHADGTTAERPGTWPSLEFDLVTIAGQDNTIGMPIFLLPLDLANGLFVDEVTGGTLTLPQVPGFSLTIFAGSATFPDSSTSGVVSVTVVHADKIPMVPNFGQQPRFIVTIQPAGVHFEPPAPITLPNLDGLGPGEVTELYSFDHDLGQFVSIGTGTVSEDGTVVASDPGVGIIKGGWHCGGNPATTGSAGACPECQQCQINQCVPAANLNGTPISGDQCQVCNNGSPATVSVSISGTPPKLCVQESKTFSASLQPSLSSFTGPSFSFPAELIVTNNGNNQTATMAGVSGNSEKVTVKAFYGSAPNQCDTKEFELFVLPRVVEGIPGKINRFTEHSFLVAECPNYPGQDTTVAHDIDGCSGGLEQDPMAAGALFQATPNLFRDDPAVHNQASTRFGQAQPPPTAASPLLPLSCNRHDICYQTCGSTQVACDNAIFTDMTAVCTAAYPATCPPGLTAAQCIEFAEERETCNGYASDAHNGLIAFGSAAWTQRQTQYCLCCGTP